MKWVVTTACTLALAACGTSNYQQDLDTWVGKPVDSLIISWGPATSESKLPDGRRVLLYKQAAISSIPGRVGSTKTNWCDTTFVIGADGFVKSNRFRGNGCAVLNGYGALINLDNRNRRRAPTSP